MSPTYYQIELNARMLTLLLVVLALMLVMSFAFGYGAAWSVLSARQVEPTPPPLPQLTPTKVATVVLPATPTVAPPPVATPARATATALPQITPTRPVRATATPVPRPTRRPPQPTVVPDTQFFWVQVLALGRHSAIEQAQDRVTEAGFPRENQRVVESTVAGGGKLYKLRIGPFPDRESAARVAQRMRGAGFPDAWILAP